MQSYTWNAIIANTTITTATVYTTVLTLDNGDTETRTSTVSNSDFTSLAGVHFEGATPTKRCKRSDLVC